MGSHHVRSSSRQPSENRWRHQGRGRPPGDAETREGRQPDRPPGLRQAALRLRDESGSHLQLQERAEEQGEDEETGGRQDRSGGTESGGGKSGGTEAGGTNSGPPQEVRRGNQPGRHPVGQGTGRPGRPGTTAFPG